MCHHSAGSSYRSPCEIIAPPSLKASHLTFAYSTTTIVVPMALQLPYSEGHVDHIRPMFLIRSPKFVYLVRYLSVLLAVPGAQRLRREGRRWIPHSPVSLLHFAAAYRMLPGCRHAAGLHVLSVSSSALHPVPHYWGSWSPQWEDTFLPRRLSVPGQTPQYSSVLKLWLCWAKQMKINCQM